MWSSACCGQKLKMKLLKSQASFDVDVCVSLWLWERATLQPAGNVQDNATRRLQKAARAAFEAGLSITSRPTLPIVRFVKRAEQKGQIFVLFSKGGFTALGRRRLVLLRRGKSRCRSLGEHQS